MDISNISIFKHNKQIHITGYLTHFDLNYWTILNGIILNLDKSSYIMCISVYVILTTPYRFPREYALQALA